jgi:hypothetical protein
MTANVDGERRAVLAHRTPPAEFHARFGKQLTSKHGGAPSTARAALASPVHPRTP